MTGPREEMACATCLTPLNVLDDQYIHPLYRDNDGHPPVPVPTSQLDTVNRTCDFCGDQYPMWTLLGGNVRVLATSSQTGLVQDMGETWAACVPCMADLDAGRAMKVADRAVRRMRVHDIPLAHAETAKLHQAFLRQRLPGRVLLTTTAWPELDVSPRDLPKVRDRLASFYRGPDELPTTLRISNVRRQLADSLDRARLYWIDDNFTELAEHAASQMPAVTASKDLAPCDDGLLVWTRPATAHMITAASWSTHDNAIEAVIYRAIGSGLEDQPLQHLREQVGWLAPTRTFRLRHDQLIDGSPDDRSAILLVTWLLIAQKAAEDVPAEIDKTIRKKYARAQRALPEVRIVRIRAHTQPDDSAKVPGTGGSRTYTSRFWVTGHWRNQAHGPGRTLRRPVYIHPFLRGPEDAPIKLSTTVRILDQRHGDKAPGN
ncbi:hypothetical protein HDA40_003723 [Hamadaea flava]|uniref:Uncharacterized protein n=1 Tax=Hamadaea flava TaxID=1742688 RepID=A0ABV8LLG3_9ACTN|nr:hypothetical protein [Hamadaea flava]MCP2325216.1 hypothetical protein [Hamadaea flava]